MAVLSIFGLPNDFNRSLNRRCAFSLQLQNMCGVIIHFGLRRSRPPTSGNEDVLNLSEKFLVHGGFLLS